MPAGKSNPIPSDIERYNTQVSVLQFMVEQSPREEVKQFRITDIASQLNKDEKDIQRSLYVLEGHKLVTPMPPGDFTSTSWCVTESGLSAVKSLNSANASLL
jgi:predicted transcriptional regulator